MGNEISATATITVAIGKQKFELSMGEAKKLIEQLEKFVGVKTRVEYVEREVPVRIPHWNKPRELPELPTFPWMQPNIICKADNFLEFSPRA